MTTPSASPENHDRQQFVEHAGVIEFQHAAVNLASVLTRAFPVVQLSAENGKCLKQVTTRADGKALDSFMLFDCGVLWVLSNIKLLTRWSTVRICHGLPSIQVRRVPFHFGACTGIAMLGCSPHRGMLHCRFKRRNPLVEDAGIAGHVFQATFQRPKPALD